MDRRVDEDDVGPLGLQALGGALAAMGGPIVDDPEDAAGRAVGLMAHDMGDEALEGSDAGRGLAASEQLGAVHVAALGHHAAR